jgi:hypothetical protein
MQIFFHDMQGVNKTGQNWCLTNRLALAFPDKPILSFQEAVKTKETLFTPYTNLTGCANRMVDYCSHLEVMLDYPNVIGATVCWNHLPSNAQGCFMAKAYDWVLASGVKCNYPTIDNYVGRSPRILSSFKSIGKSYTERDIFTVYIGRAETNLDA